MGTAMLWRKAWLDTRARFLGGLFIVIVATCGVVLSHPRAVEVMTAVERAPETVLGSGPVAGRLAEALTAARVYRGYVFTQLYRQELPQIWCLFAMLLGA